MEQNTKIQAFPTTYREVKVGSVVYRVTSVFKGEKDLAKSLEQLCIRKVMADIRTGATRPVA